jgi:hypothetical protein
LYPLARINVVQAHVGRFISTERKKRLKEHFWRQVRFHSYLWPSLALLVLLMSGIKHVKLEQDFPTPREWSFWSRWEYRMAKHTETSEDAKLHRVLTDWGTAGLFYKNLLERLETEEYDGKNLIDNSVHGDKLGFNIEAKSDQWRRGYYDALMGAAHVAENLYGMCRRKGQQRGRIYPRDSIPGPDNPRPKPLPWNKKKGQETPPSADEVEDAFPSPEYFYERIISTEGFDTRQKLEAQLALADWLDFNGHTEKARTVYHAAIQCAYEGLPKGTDLQVGNIHNVHSGVINKEHDGIVTENILKASTALGVFHAKNGQVKDALPVFLSVLRARKSLPPSPLGATGEEKKHSGETDGLWNYIYALKDLVIERPYPDPPPSGNERPFHTLKEACEEVGLMTYIGEILFATSDSEREKGLSWTRDSIEAAEAVMWVMDEQKVSEGREKCRQCLETGLQNWKAMAKQMTRMAAQKEQDISNSSGWLGTGWGKSSQLRQAHTQTRRWEEEREQIELRRQKTLPLTQPLQQGVTPWQS